jgi:hypothetical protein
MKRRITCGRRYGKSILTSGPQRRSIAEGLMVRKGAKEIHGGEPH